MGIRSLFAPKPHYKHDGNDAEGGVSRAKQDEKPQGRLMDELYESAHNDG